MATRQPRSAAKGTASGTKSNAAGASDAVESTVDRAEENAADRSAETIANDLSYAEARTALDLALAQLQATDLNVEAMAGLFQRAQSYARRCETLLAEVEQQVLLWNSTDPSSAPQPFRADQD